MAGLKSTLVRAAIALLIVEGVVSANRAGMKYRRAGEVNMCGKEYTADCCPDDVNDAVDAGTVCGCRCIDDVQTVSLDDTDKFCLPGQGATVFTLVPHDIGDVGDSAAGGTGSMGHTTRPNGIMSYMMWIGIVFTLIYVIQISQRH